MLYASARVDLRRAPSVQPGLLAVSSSLSSFFGEEVLVLLWNDVAPGSLALLPFPTIPEPLPRLSCQSMDCQMSHNECFPFCHPHAVTHFTFTRVSLVVRILQTPYPHPYVWEPWPCGALAVVKGVGHDRAAGFYRL